MRIKNSPRLSSRGVLCIQRKLAEKNYVSSLRTLGVFLNGEFDFLTFFKVFETITLDRGEVDEDIRAAFAGLLGLVLRRDIFHAWSAALGRTGIVFWLTYLPLSLFAMQANWNGLFLAEPRFRIAMIFAVTGVLLQLGLWLFSISWLTSLANILYIIALRVVFATAQNVMHPPPSPIFNSGNYTIIGFFISLILLSWLAAYFLTRWFLRVGEAVRQ